MSTQQILETNSFQSSLINPINTWELLHQTSRSFYPSIIQLPGVLKDAICLAYLLLRVSDFFEDNLYMPLGQKVTWLNLWDRVLNGGEIPENWKDSLYKYIASDDPEAYVAYLAGEIIDKFKILPVELREIIRHHVHDTTIGMARWLIQGPNVSREDDMDDYMHEVAGRVGYLLTEAFAWHSKAIKKRIGSLMPLARETGIALQTVNILRGMYDDYKRGWIYIPDSFCESINLRKEDLFNPENQEQGLAIVDMLANKAERHLLTAMQYIKALPTFEHHIRLFIIWPVFIAARTVAISRHNIRVLHGGVKVGREEVVQIIRNTTIFGWSNFFLDRYFKKLLGETKIVA